MKLLVRILLFFLANVLLPSIGSASETYFVVVPDNVDQLNDPAADYWFEPKCNIMMSGTLDLGTVAGFEKAVEELNSQSTIRPVLDRFGMPIRKGYRALCMSSGGGDLHAALDLIPKLANWIAVVPENAICASACAIAFMGAGRDVGPYADVGRESVNRREARYLHITGQLSFHAPRLELDGKSFTQKDVINHTIAAG